MLESTVVGGSVLSASGVVAFSGLSFSLASSLLKRVRFAGLLFVRSPLE